MKVTDVMSRDVVVVSPHMPLKDVARVLANRHFSGLPVVDDDRTVLGVVSEADILAKERGPGSARSIFGRALELETWGDKHGARNAGTAMTAMLIRSCLTTRFSCRTSKMATPPREMWPTFSFNTSNRATISNPSCRNPG